MVKSKNLSGWLAAIALAAPLSAFAVPVTWNFSGALSVADNTPSGLPVHVGSPFSMTLTFDPATFSAPLLDAGGTWSYYYGNDIHFSLDFGFDCRDSTNGYQTCTDEAGGASQGELWLLNSAFGATTDGMLFSLFPEGRLAGKERWNFGVSGPANIFSTLPSVIPDMLDPRFTSLTVNACGGVQPGQFLAFSVCSAGETRIGGPVTAVPEPGTLVLLGLGLGAIGLARRRQLKV